MAVPHESLLVEIDPACERFEEALRGPAPPRIEDYLDGWQGVARDVLFRHLLELELDYRTRRGDLPSPERYQDRFPEYSTLVDEVLTPQAYGSERGPAPLAANGEPLRRRIGDYEILREIGRGGMGIVYQAHQRSLNRTVALKILPTHAAHDPLTRERFRREARAAAKLHHTNIVPVFDVGEEGEICFYAMQYIEARSLDVAWRRLTATPGDVDAPADSGTSDVSTDGGDSTETRGTLRENSAPSWDSTLSVNPSDSDLEALRGSRRANASIRGFHRGVARVGLQVANALQYAHDRGVIHRDIKPSNLLLDDAGVAWVTDFGLAKTDEDGLTLTGDLLGTLRYMSPERFSGHCDERGDLYGLGATLYELATRHRLFVAQDRMELIRQISRDEPASPRAIDPRIPRDLETILLKGLSKDPRRRYQSARDMAEDLRRFLDDQPIRARRVSVPEQLARWARKNRGLAAALAIVAFLLLATTAASLAAARIFRAQEREQHRLALSESVLRKKADAASDKVRENLYDAQMNLAANAAESISGVAQVRELVRPWVPERGQRDLRGWEWYLLNALGHSERRVIETGQDSRSIAWSPDGRDVAVGGSHGVAVWDPATGASRGEFRADLNYASSVAWNTRGSQLAACGLDGTLVVWDAASRRVVDRVRRCQGGGSLSWSPDDRWLAFHGWDRTIRIRDTRSKQDSSVLAQDLDDPPARFGFSGDGRYFASQIRIGKQERRDVRVWETAAWTEVCTLQGNEYILSAIAWSPDCRRLAGSRQDGGIWIWDLRTAKVERKVPSLGYLIADLSWSPDGKKLAAASWGLGVPIWNAATGDQIALLRGHTAAVQAVCWSPDSESVATTGSDKTIRIWDLTRPPPIRTLDLHRPPSESLHVWSPFGYTSLAWNRDGTRLATSLGNQGTRIWDTGRWEVVDTIPGVASAWSRGDSYLISTHGETLDVRKRTSNPIVKQCELIGQPKRFAWNPVEGGLLAIRMEKSLWLWDVPRENRPVKIREQLGGFNGLAWSPDGRLLAASADDKGKPTVILWDAARASVVKTLPGLAGIIHAIAFSRDGRQLACAGEGATIDIWDCARWQRVRVLRGHTFAIPSLDWSADGTRLASSSVDGSVKLWDTATGQQTFSQSLPGIIRCVAWSPDGSRVAAISENGIVRIWDARLGYPPAD